MVYNYRYGREINMTSNDGSENKAPTEKIEDYLGWLLAGKLAEWLGMKVGVEQSGDGEVFILVIELPSGQVHKVIPGYAVEGKWKKFNSEDYQNRRHFDEVRSIEDCLNGFLVLQHKLVIPEQKEEIE